MDGEETTEREDHRTTRIIEKGDAGHVMRVLTKNSLSEGEKLPRKN